MSKDSKKPAWWKQIFGEEKLAEITTVDGTVLSYEGDLKEGTVMMGADGKPAKEGDYQCEIDGKTFAITLDTAGAIASMQEVTAMSENEEAFADALKQINETVKNGFAETKKLIDAKDARIKALEDYLSKDGKFSAHNSKKKTADEEAADKKKKGFRAAL